MTLRQQPFTSPGTWVHPGDPQLKYVDVILVGGGGAIKTNPLGTFSGGGGGIRIETGVPVSGPVPVSIGAGGTGTPAPSGTPGGSSSFGPVTVGGGGAGYSSAPSDGGGAGSLYFNITPPNTPNQAIPGKYGAVSAYGIVYGGAGGAFSQTNYNHTGFGAAGCTASNQDYNGYGSEVTRVVANTGAGASDGPTLYRNTSGAPGIVVVRWFE